MENLLKAKGLWGLIERGVEEPKEGTTLNQTQQTQLDELRMKDCKTKYGSNEKVKKSMLNTLRRDFELLEMKNTESIKEYFSRVTAMANKIRSNGEVTPDSKLQSSLAVHEQKFKKMNVEEDHALKVEETKYGSGGGRMGSRGRGRGRGRSLDKATVECYKCHKLGHFRFECPSWDKANYAEAEEEEEMLLMTLTELESSEGNME
ncbi:uncharacterized protein LOC124920849 [Impatiens glandulifera]|uniref:uncharacterized protein LOC124920849 n=1 Tax=Impatiens glandulifera TaxID=253017 RepID=UPI001FB157A3|nr:uncharacterized protein LOC124920849 [Impatiens glandulifera]